MSDELQSTAGQSQFPDGIPPDMSFRHVLAISEGAWRDICDRSARADRQPPSRHRCSENISPPACGMAGFSHCKAAVLTTGTLLKASYILNGSATGRCETDDGTGNLAKR